ncbi:MAG: hypothetical protein K6C68_00830 [Ruminococcus sp.]|nr:hypothetical protein [Ruminococcus sp.]
MGNKDSRADLAFPYNLPDVFNTVVQIAPILGMTVKFADSMRNTIHLSKDMNLITWGENITVYLGILPDRRTGVTIISSSKLGTEIGARKANFANVTELSNALYSRLPGGCPQQQM